MDSSSSSKAFIMVRDKDCTPWELIEFLTELSSKKSVKLKQMRSNEHHNLLHEMVHKGRLSLFVVIIHLGLWRDLSRERVPRHAPSDHTGCTPGEIAQAKRTKKAIEEINAYDKWEDSLTPLMKACRSGDIREVKERLQYNNSSQQLHAKDSHGMNALYWAVVSGNRGIVTVLLDAGIDPEVKNEKEETLLHVAAIFGKTNLIEMLVTHEKCKFDPYKEDLTPKSAYDRCAENGDIATLKQFIKVGKKPKDSFLVITAFNGRDECARYCINSLKMNVNGVDIYSRTALHRACEGNRVQLVKFLIAQGADLTVCSSNNRNLLHMAAENGNVELLQEIVKALKATSTNLVPMLNQRDRYAGSDLCFLIRGNDKKRDAWHYCEVRRWKYPVFLRKTRQGNVDVGQFGEIIRSGWGVSPSQEHMTQIENTFKTKRLDPNAAEDMTPLHAACFKGHAKVVEMLLDLQAEPNVKDAFGLTPIMLAAAKGELDIVENLQKSGASLKEISNDNQDIISIAQYNEQEHVKAYLLNLDIFQLSDNFVRANMRKVRQELSPQKLTEVRQSGQDVKKHVIDTLREFKIDINQYLVDIGSGPVLEASEE